MKKLNLLLLIVSVLLLTAGYSQKPKKTYNSEKFASKVKFSFVPEYVNSRAPDENALRYIAEKTGKKFWEVEDQDKKDRQSLKDDVTQFSKYGLIFSLERVEEKIKQETPIKIADIIMHCASGDEKFTITLENCVQTNISWYLDDGCSWEGSVFKDLEKDIIKVDENTETVTIGNTTSDSTTTKPKVDLGLPAEFDGLVGSWRFKAVYEGDKDMTDLYEDGFLNERPITMLIEDDSYVMFQKGVRDRNNFDYCFWKYLKPEERDERESEIDFTMEYHYKDGNKATEKIHFGFCV